MLVHDGRGVEGAAIVAARGCLTFGDEYGVAEPRVLSGSCLPWHDICAARLRARGALTA